MVNQAAKSSISTVVEYRRNQASCTMSSASATLPVSR
ncbi:Uncharacterised protein [Mycobacteroides abscessus subsp. abscessus]|nr:Uncharacterised protein [Mycobacteroides abscessus subsp. abscessus]